jgi:acyl-CoA thioester hydrolase
MRGLDSASRGRVRPRRIGSVAAIVFQYSHRVTYSDCTIGDHIYYSRYLEILEAARGEFFRTLGLPLSKLQDGDTIFPVLECRVHYLRPARYDDLLLTHVSVILARGARLNFRYRMLTR